MTWSWNCSADQNKRILWSHHARTGKNREIKLNQQTIQCQVLVWLNKIWSRLIFIKLYKSGPLFFLSALPAFHVLKIEIGCCPPQFYIQLFIVVHFLLHSCENSKSHWLKRCEENPTAIQVFCHVAKNLNSSKIYHPIFFFDFFVFCKVTNGYLDFVNTMK